MAKIKAILVAVDGSANSDRAVRHALDLVASGLAAECTSSTCSPSLRGAVASFVAGSRSTPTTARKATRRSPRPSSSPGRRRSPAEVHIGVGRQGEVVADFAKKLKAGLIVVGTRGHTGLSGVLLGSVAQDVIAHVDVPVTLVK